MSIEVPQKLTILSVDDSAVMQQLIKTALAEQYRVIVCSSAIQALAIIDQEPIAVMLLDVTMPEMDGFDFCRTIRSIPKFQSLPVVMLTARDSSLDKLQGKLAGATEYLTKPFDGEQLRAIVSQLICSEPADGVSA